jgi:thiosulfate dehydrogenase
MMLLKRARLLFSFLLLGLVLAIAANVQGQDRTLLTPSDNDLVQGALLYDNWYATLGINPPSGNMPIWSRQSTNTRSGPDTWRCSECHGWDYLGVDGAYGSGSHRTGFPNVMALANKMTAEDIVAHLKGMKDPAHDFSAYMDNTTLAQLAVFLKNGMIDDTEYINPVSLQVIQGDIAHGQQLFASTCASCHGSDGKQIAFRTEGIVEYLGSIANRDPWRFLHRTRFGTAGTNMPIGYTLGWSPADGRDLLAFGQSLPTGGEIAIIESTSPASHIPTPLPGSGPSNWFTGIFTGLGIVTVMGGYAVLFIGGFLLVGIIVVTILRKRKQ